LPPVPVVMTLKMIESDEKLDQTSNPKNRDKSEGEEIQLKSKTKHESVNDAKAIKGDTKEIKIDAKEIKIDAKDMLLIDEENIKVAEDSKLDIPLEVVNKKASEGKNQTLTRLG
jgi:hypothetical protein